MHVQTRICTYFPWQPLNHTEVYMHAWFRNVAELNMFGRAHRSHYCESGVTAQNLSTNYKNQLKKY